MKYLLLLISIFFVLFSFSPSLYEIYQAKNLTRDRVFILEHNYMFDYNFYLSRIREGQEGRWLVTEKYYSQPHQGSLFQIIYLLFGRVGGLINLSPPVVYHSVRLLMGFMLLILTGNIIRTIFKGRWQVIAFLLVVTSGSYPILMKAGNFWRFGTYMGWWSAIDSLQRISFLPHVLIGQIFILLFTVRFGSKWPKQNYILKVLAWGTMGLAVGIVFPPALVVVYTVIGVQTFLEFIGSKSLREPKLLINSLWFTQQVVPRIIFITLSFPSFIYLKVMFAFLPWSALTLFDVMHRTPLPYKEYFLGLGPVLPLGVIGLCIAIYKREQKLLPFVSWVIAVGMLFMIFENVPQQTPLRFTEAAIHIPLGILTAYLFWVIYRFNRCRRSLAFVKRWGVGIVVTVIIIMGIGVMGSMFFWLKDQADAKRVSGWTAPLGAQLAYPLKDFMGGIYYLRDHSNKEEVVLTYITAGNYIPAYAGNHVYIGHANTPDEDGKEKIAAKFFKGEMTKEEANNLLVKEHISYIYFGPQERELGNIKDLNSVYPFVSAVYSNNQVRIYRINKI